ncbi:MAG TPA: TetR/AcrR family transcriptional regulator [Acetobacteraceae bacterium]|jgi:TetR/AcrR family transcriptional repressor of mexJK operon|nr:TetR/AcrR family transcriptional regulator [Acetobacteraceae bacterium]
MTEPFSSVWRLEALNQPVYLTLMNVIDPVRPETESPKRQLILEAANRLFIAHGYGAVSMDSIARSAGVSKATLYAHFGSKDQLFATIITEACQAKFDWSSAVTEDSRDLRTALTALGRRILGFFLEEGTLAIYRVVIAESARFPELGRAFYESGPATGRRLLATWLAEQAEAGRLLVPDPLLAAEQLVGLLRAGLYFRATLGVPPAPTQADIDVTVAAAIDTFLAAYGRA